MDTLQVDRERLVIYERLITVGVFDMFFFSILTLIVISTDTSLFPYVIVFLKLKAPRVSCFCFFAALISLISALMLLATKFMQAMNYQNFEEILIT